MLDTGVLLAGTVWPRFSYEVLQHALAGDFDLVLCPMILGEARRKFREKFPSFAADFEELLDEIPCEEVADPTPAEVQENSDLMRDITDVPIALAAIKAAVDHFVSEDKDFTAAHKTTAKLHRRLHVLLPGTFLRKVMRWTGEDLEMIRRRTWVDLAEG